ncbi:MAG: phosphatidylserine decarboxylase [Acidobacteria bacterium]|nr:MAG: phosphatidylserine decarboxylase [Acidobacteriota bacterium]
MHLDKAATPYLAATLLPAAFLAGLRRPGWALPLAAAGGFFAYFFRDPDRQPPGDAEAILAPADGKVMAAGPPIPGVAPPGEWLQVSIFLSPLDVHVNRSPVSGRVTRVEYRPGAFYPAYDGRASTENERSEIWIEADNGTFVCRQVAGVMARRIVCRVSEGSELTAGARFGLIKFGSRTDLFMPPGATILVAPGDRVRGGETIVGRLAR